MTGFWGNFECLFGPHKTVASPTISTSHGSDLVEVLEITRMNNDIINHMPMSVTWVLPCNLVFVFLTKSCVSNHNIMLVVKLYELKTIAVCLTYSVRAKSVPSLIIFFYSSVQIT